MVSKMLAKGVVQYLKGTGLLFAFVLAVLSAAPLRAAASTYGLSDHSSNQNAGMVEQLVVLAVSDAGLQPADRSSAVDQASAPDGVQLLVYSPDGQDQTDEFSTVARHRGFRKFFLLVFICGAVIRFFTSPTFVAFITDALDPKAW